MGNKEQQIVKVGDLVVYDQPNKYMRPEDHFPYGLVLIVEDNFARVVWSDGEVYLESTIDLKILND